MYLYRYDIHAKQRGPYFVFSFQNTDQKKGEKWIHQDIEMLMGIASFQLPNIIFPHSHLHRNLNWLTIISQSSMLDTLPQRLTPIT